MFFERVYDKSLAQASYLIGCQKMGVAAVIDAKRDVDTYLEIAKANQLKITHIFETHIHADFLAGSRELAALTGAEMYLSAEGGEGWEYEFPHHRLKHGNIVKLGNLSFEVIHTPGHTPESISFLLTDHPASDKPVMLFTGDFVFVGDVGRPDLLEKAAGISGTAQMGALQMHDSIEKFKTLQDYIQVWPGHGAGSACGKSLGAVPGSTVGYEKLQNPFLKFDANRADFVKYLLEDQPEPPYYFAMMKKLNKVDRPLLTTVKIPDLLSAVDFKNAIRDGVKLIDTRHKKAFAKGFIPGSINIQHNNSLSTWAGWILNYEEPFILLADPAELEDISRKLMRIGLDNVMGYIPDTDKWTSDGGKLDFVAGIDIATFKDVMHEVQIIDVRNATEYNEGHIPGAENIFVGHLSRNLNKISQDKPVVIHCQSGDRSSIAYSILARNGYDNIRNYAGGMSEWAEEQPQALVKNEKHAGMAQS